MNAANLSRFGKVGTLILLVGMVFALGQPVSQAQSAAAYGFSSRMPSASAPDPDGKTFNLSQNSGQPTVVIVSAPNMSQGSIQQDWVNSLSSLSTHANFFLVEDMTAAFFRDVALSDMKKDYAEGDRPVVLVDNQGSVRQALGAPRGKTCVMIYSSSNRLVYVQVGNASPAAVQAVNKVIAAQLN